MNKPRALDLFCCAGGATRGLQLAGFHVTGIDIEPQPRYVGDEFHQADALEFPLEGFDFIWASPPCQAYTPASNTAKKQGHVYPMLVGNTRRRLEDSGALFAMENVPGAPLRRGSILLCGLSFGLPLLRHRRIESNFMILAPAHVRHRRGAAVRREVFTIFGKSGSLTNRNRGKSQPYSTARRHEAQRALSIDWMNYAEMAEAVPPAYSEFIGRQAIALIKREAA